MEEDPLRYDLWIEEALRTVIRRSLQYAASDGLPGEHHFYITFQTDDDGVVIPDYLRAEHPEEMTIVLQHQFDDLQVDEETLTVMLRFNGNPETLVVPLSSVTSFADPSVNFGLQLKMTALEGEEFEFDASDVTGMETAVTGEPGNTDSAPTDDNEKTGEVIALDAFRKK
ncbi:MAG: ClpXP protease specificity-enhancing factor SspB [Pseudomonadota bacterium]|nr:ClpXP protease specificity-enhancing factor SspB [Pseudomonadota bacterium]